MLGPDADDDTAAVASHEGGLARRGLGRQRELLGAERDDELLGGPGHGSFVQVHRRGAHERGDEEIGRPVVESLGRGELLEQPPVEDGDPVAHRHRLGLIVGDIERRDSEPALDAQHLGAHLHAQLRVEVRERLVHQEHARLAHDRPAHRDSLALAARELAGLLPDALGEPEQLDRVVDPLLDHGLRQLLQPQREADVRGDRHVRVQGVVLEHHRDVALSRRGVVHDPVADAQVPVGDVLEPGDHPQGRRLPAPGGADEHHELAVGHRQVELVDRLEAVRVDLRHLLEADRRHGWMPSP